MNTTIRTILTNSIPLNVASVACSIGKIGASSAVLLTTKTKCNLPFDIWLYTMIGHDVINIWYMLIEIWFSVMIRRENQRRDQQGSDLFNENILDPFSEEVRVENGLNRILPNQTTYERRRFECSFLNWTRDINRMWENSFLKTEFESSQINSLKTDFL